MTENNLIKKYLININQEKVKQDGNVFSFEVTDLEILELCKKLYFEDKLQLKIITATDERNEKNGFRVWYVFGVPQENIFLVPYISIKNKEEFPSIAKDIYEASGYERKIQSFFGLLPVGHPDTRKIILHEDWPEKVFPLRKDFNWKERPALANGTYNFLQVDGEGIYEIPVGPVHAGIIEPGHFRFSMAGEEIILLEAKLGYKHRGVEKLFEVFSLENKLKLSERVSGDTSFTHSLAFCQAIENLAKIKLSKKAQYLRVIFSELERLANHFNDAGFIMLDTGYSFGGSNCARLRERIMQINERLTGSRFLRGVNAIGGVQKNISNELASELIQELKLIQKDFKEVMEIVERSNSVYNRMRGTGTLEKQLALDHGVVGVAGRASGIAHDARKEYPYAVYAEIKFNIATEDDGDVLARFHIRVKEIFSSMDILTQALKMVLTDNFGEQLISGQKIVLPKNSLAMGISEGWRGDIVYFVMTDSDGDISRVDVRDSSFLNWTAVGHAAKGDIVPDFPLINKSFNLSYSGNDL